MQRSNNFDALRQFAAFLVIIGHSQTLLGAPVSSFGDTTVSDVGVHIFFGLSGYLVTDSWLRDPHAGRFLLKRSLRIFPGLALCVLVTVFVLGPALTTLPLADYFASPQTYDYLRNILMRTVYDLPGVFATNIYPQAVNGSLWTLPVEFMCYVGVLVVGLMCRRPRLLLALLAGLILILLADLLPLGHQPLVNWSAPIKPQRSIMGYFVSGAVLRLLKDRLGPRADLAVVAVAAIIAASLLWPGRTWLASGVALPYLALCFGLGSLPIIRRAGRLGDPSYGMYLYAFPVQQALIYLSGNAISLPMLILLTTVISVLCGYASWQLVEKRALQWAKTGRPETSALGADAAK